MGGNAVTPLIKSLAAVAAGTVLATTAFAQSAREARGPTPYFAVENEPAPKLIVDPVLPGPLAFGVAQIQYRVENVRIIPAFGGGRPQTVSTGRASAHYRRRSALVVGGLE